jgi:hypothetical protein
MDDVEQEKAMHYFTAKNAAALKKATGLDPTGGMLYAMHLLGQAGGQNVITNPDKPLTETISSGALKGNPWLYNYKTGRDLLAALNRRFG